MIRIHEIKLPVAHSEEDVRRKAAKLLRVEPSAFLRFTILRRSIDARKKPELYVVYTVEVEAAGEERVLKNARAKKGQLQTGIWKPYSFPVSGERELSHRPIIVGTGPAGLFCGYMLAKAGYQPLLLERGQDVKTRLADVERFWQEGILNPSSNVQFGEGGAGTFSDGKLTTSVKDPCGRQREVLRIFVEAGAPEEILYDAKPHIGTDILCRVVENLRNKITAWGGEVRFASQVTSLLCENDKILGVEAAGECIYSDVVVLAIGHSARDTFQMLYGRKVPMEPKAFAVGLRMEHPRKMIDQLQYGESADSLPAAPYKVTAKTESGRGVYSFCMCPGGYVVNASSEPGMTAVNGMSYSGRDGANSNSAMIVTLTPEDYGGTWPLAGVAFQRELEKKAYEIGSGAVPVERYGDFKRAVLESRERLDSQGSLSSGMEEKSSLQERYPDFSPAIKGSWRFAPVHDILPDFLNQALVEGVDLIGQSISGFDDPDAFLSGVESRTSSPVRILRDDTGQSALRGLYPCGEGAGYAGGITSAAMDGILIAEKVASLYHPVVR